MRRILIVVLVVLGLLVIGGCSVLAFRGNGEAAAQTATARPNVSVGVVATPTSAATQAGTKAVPVIRTVAPTVNGSQATNMAGQATLDSRVATLDALRVTATALISQRTPLAVTLVPTPASTSISTSTAVDYKLDWTAAWYQSPFSAFTKAQLADKATYETLAEPGINLDETAAFDHMTASTTPVLVPEGATTYVAIGSLSFSNVKFEYVARNNYQFLFRGIPSDGKPETDLNRIVNVSGYTPGTGIFDALRAGAYVSQDWFIDQIKNSGRSPNCGEGCQMVTVVIVDLKTATYRQWTTTPSNPTVWVRK